MRCAATATLTAASATRWSPDLRCPDSQPAPTLYALEIVNEAGAAGGEIARDARAWIASIAEPDGGIPFVVPGFEDYPHAPWWAAAASSSGTTPQPGSFLTLARAAVLHAGGVSDDDWLARATEWSWCPRPMAPRACFPVNASASVGRVFRCSAHRKARVQMSPDSNATASRTRGGGISVLVLAHLRGK